MHAGSSEQSPALAVLVGEDDQKMDPVHRIRASECIRILIVDDNVDGAEALAEILRDDGHSVFTAHDGRQAIELFDAIEPEIAILDLQLPLLDGLELARFVRADARFRATPLIAYSCLDSESDRERTKAAGFDHHVSKLDVRALEELIATYTK